MDSSRAERRALKWLVLSLAALIISMSIAPRTTGPWPWLVPLVLAFNVASWLQLWRHHRRVRIARANDAA